MWQCVKACGDGFVIGGGATRVMKQGSFSGEANMPFWLQLVGTGDYGGVLTATSVAYSPTRPWPAVNCHQLYTHSMLIDDIEVKGGTAAVPTGPGLGYALDRDAVERFKVNKPEERPDPDRLVEAHWPDGRRMYFASGSVNFVLRPGIEGKIPFYERGVDARLLPNDGSAQWRKLFEKTKRDGPVLLES